jgi:hypothetical protein
LNLDDYLPPAPLQPQNRFWYPVQFFEGGVIPLVPYSEERLNTDFDLYCVYDCGAIRDTDVESWEASPFNVGLLCGKPSGTTVLQVTSRSGQSWLDEQDLPCTPQWLCRRSRCYVFFGDALPEPVTEIRPGVRLLSTGAHVALPGSIYEDGRLVYWESSPDDDVIVELPSWLIPGAAKSAPLAVVAAVGACL